MRHVFADILYWTAISYPRDPWGQAARRAAEGLGTVRLITTDEVLTEYLTSMSGLGAYFRQVAVDLVEVVLSHPDMRVMPQSRTTFLDGLDLYRRRLDKSYSLVDCISMTAMRSQGIVEVLTNDRHFEQEGFTLLVR